MAGEFGELCVMVRGREEDFSQVGFFLENREYVIAKEKGEEWRKNSKGTFLPLSSSPKSARRSPLRHPLPFLL